MSLRWRLALILAVVVAAAVALVSSAAYLSAERELSAGVDRSLSEEVAATRIRPPGLPASRGRDHDVQVIDARGEIVESTSDLVLPVDAIDIEVARGERTGALRSVTIDDRPYRMLTTSRGPLAVQVVRDLTEMNSTLDRLRNRLIVVGLMGTVGAALVGWVVAWRFTRPIRQLTRATGEIAERQGIVEPIPVDRADEVGELAASFNTMATALESSRRQQQQLVMDASHELRTPLTTLRANIELLRRAPDLPARDRQAALETATLELEELSALVGELVELATDQPSDRLDLEDIGLDALVGSIVARARRRTGRTISLSVDNGATVHGSPTRLTRAVSNLLDNADKFSPPGVPIEVTVRGSAVVVADHGPGVAVEDRERVFDRFYRSDPARTLPGSGLGLAIVAQVATDHGGRVEVDPTPGGGATFTLTLPSA